MLNPRTMSLKPMELPPIVFDQLRVWIHKACGIQLNADKEYLIRQRLGRIVVEENCKDFNDFFQKLQKSTDPDLRKRVITAITTNETYFFRDQHPFETISQTLLPRFLEKLRDKKGKSLRPVIRIWSAGASTGQEAYSVAMLIHEFCEKPGTAGVELQNFEIVGSDVSVPALAQAQSGEYSDFEIQRGLLPARRDRYFTQITGNCWQISKEIRKIVNFRRMNFMENFSTLGNFDLILCRNVLIYFDNPTKSRIFESFAAMLEPGGCLLLGASESIYGLNTTFQSKKIGMTFLYEKNP